nr:MULTISPECIES: relaxase/mobilization nuclease domain-containing protein [unclassified Lactococcus]
MSALNSGKNLTLNPETGLMEFDMSSLEKNNATLAHHLIQSFSPEDNLTPEEIHEIGRKTVLKLTGGNHEFVITTHTDKEHIHNHIIFNSTNLVTGNYFRWQKGTKRIFEQISDKHASKMGAKIIEKSPKNSHTKYTMWQIENIYQKKINQRLDFLIEHSTDIEDFKRKASALNLSCNFDVKWSTFKLTDEPQKKNTRSRSLSKKDPERYNIERITERLKKNNVALTVDEVLERYEEKNYSKKTRL